MALALAALLYIGLSMDSAAQVQGGSLPRPVLRAEPGSVVARGSAVTLWCEGAWKAQEFRLYKEGDKDRWSSKIPGTPGNRTAFFIWSMTKDKAGRYFCFYQSPAGWSDHSEPLELVVTENSSNSFTLPSEPDSRPKCPPEDHIAQNLLRLGLALLVLVALVWLLAEDWLSRKKRRLELQAGDVRDGRRLGGPGGVQSGHAQHHLPAQRLPVVLCCALCWHLHFPLNLALGGGPMYSFCSVPVSGGKTFLMGAVVFSVTDAMCLGLMGWASGSVLLVLHRHRWRVRASCERQAAPSVLLLVSLFLSFYALASVLSLCSMQVGTPSPWLASSSYLASSGFSTLSHLVFGCSDSLLSCSTGAVRTAWPSHSQPCCTLVRREGKLRWDMWVPQSPHQGLRLRRLWEEPTSHGNQFISGLSMDSAAQGQGGSLPRPVLRAEPSSVVARGSTVTLWCKRAWKTQKFRLYKEGDKDRWALKIPGTLGKRTAFFIWSMKKDNAGRYFCFYQSPAGWSDHSEPLELVVTENSSNSFTLPSEPDSRPKFPPGDHTAQNLLRLGLALLVLVALVWLLAEDWLSRKKRRLELQAGDVRDGRRLGGPGAAHDLMVPNFHLHLRRLPWSSRWHCGLDGCCPVGSHDPGTGGTGRHQSDDPHSPTCPSPPGDLLEIMASDSPTPPYPVCLGQAEPSVCQAPHWPGSPWAMPSTLPALLWAGLCLSQIGVHTQTLSKPTIRAIPSHLVPVGSRVEIWCQGVRGAVEYQLHFEGGLQAVERPKSPGSESNARFLISVVSQGSAGQYRCLYWSGELWSEYSDLLDLVVTGLYDTPTLSVHPGPEVAMGEPVTFRCQLDMATNTFFLMKEGWPGPEQLRFGNLQAEFSMGPATRSHRGTYRCFGSYNNHLWSFPSNPVKLEVTGDVGNTSFAPTNPPTSSPGPWQAFNSIPGWGLQQDFTPGDHTAQNLLRLGLALLVLVALAWLLAEDRISRKKAQAGAASWGRSIWQTARRPWMNGRSRGAHPGGEAGTLSCLSCDGQTEGGTAGNGGPLPGVGLQGVPCPCP
ncbi:uncharacterized protein [Dipodomys merriami]|uniref:uncharacterized protein n=1 Tax=Dipodomys merriami TaxID=94247 RepID=UPI00385588CA